ncbi:Copine I-like [Zostera marina]|uniref:Copine I-like n=1 Tax=Zostera marina TaxID=29655 RepID=A0A0K9P9F9_ZOSMR|nr:Copine I-like [Zostera marina]
MYSKNSVPYIGDNFNTLDQVISALRSSGLESSNLILGIDFTKSNEWTGRRSFHRKSLHAIGSMPNPYEQAISIIGRTLSPFDDDDLIPCFGFGDVSTRDKNVFSFYPDHRPCNGFKEVLDRYRDIVPLLHLSGPTTFAPLIYASIEIVKRSRWQYHVLVIIADGQVATSSNTPQERRSPHEKETINAIVAASYYPLSIIMVGLGDGPWDEMQRFDDSIPHRSFDNFQFVNFTKIMSSSMDMEKKETSFALAALMEIPFQYKATQSIQYSDLGENFGSYITPPPKEVIEHDNRVGSFSQSGKSKDGYSKSADQATQKGQECPICLVNPKDMTFGCGHLTCKECGTSEALKFCPLCRVPITTRVRLYS